MEPLLTQLVLVLLQVVSILLELFATQDDPGEAFSFTQAFIQGDAIDTTGPDIGDVSAYSNQLSTAAGTTGDLLVL